MKKSIEFTQQELEDLISVYRAGKVACEKKHKDSPKFLSAIDKLEKKILKKVWEGK